MVGEMLRKNGFVTILVSTTFPNVVSDSLAKFASNWRTSCWDFPADFPKLKRNKRKQVATSSAELWRNVYCESPVDLLVISADVLILAEP